MFLHSNIRFYNHVLVSVSINDIGSVFFHQLIACLMLFRDNFSIYSPFYVLYCFPAFSLCIKKDGISHTAFYCFILTALKVIQQLQTHTDNDFLFACHRRHQLCASIAEESFYKRNSLVNTVKLLSTCCCLQCIPEYNPESQVHTELQL